MKRYLVNYTIEDPEVLSKDEIISGILDDCFDNVENIFELVSEYIPVTSTCLMEDFSIEAFNGMLTTSSCSSDFDRLPAFITQNAGNYVDQVLKEMRVEERYDRSYFRGYSIFG